MARPGTLCELRASGWESRPGKQEVRANALARIATGKPLVDGVIGFGDTVLPQLENALLAGHDIIFLGERGQAKTRIIRSLVDLLDELTIHYGLVPRTNRGIFAINELPDLAERIQVGLLNVLEERDVQIRGYKIRLPLDLMLVASATPEDYTNRGRIITPLKDRFGSQIRTHYPLDTGVETAIMRQEARPISVGEALVHMPDYMEAIVATFSHLA